MKKAIYAAGILLSGLLSSCSNDTEVNESTLPEVSIEKRNISLVINNGNDTRVSHEEVADVISLTWNEGDQVLVESVNETSVYTYDTFVLGEGGGTNSGKFTGSIPADAVTLNVYFPTTVTNEDFKLNTQKQTDVASLAHLANYDVMFASNIDASGNEISFSLEHKGMIFTLPITNSTGEVQKIIGITLANEKSADLGSVFAKSVQVSDGAFAMTATPSFTLGIENGTVEADAEYKAYMLVCMEDLTALNGQNLDVIVHTEKGRHTITKTAVEFTAGTRYTLNSLVMDATNFADVLKLVGGATAGGYDLGQAATLTNNNDGTYLWTGPLKGAEFKVVDHAANWGDEKFQLYKGDENQFVMNDYDGTATKFNVSASGFYDVQVDFNTMNLLITPNTTQTWIFPIGAATPYGWEMDQAIFGHFTDINPEGTIIKGSLTFNPGNFKFLCEADFDGLTIYAASANQNLVGEQDILVAKGDANDYQWLVDESNKGTYHITINLDTNKILFEKQDIGVGLPGYGNGEF